MLFLAPAALANPGGRTDGATDCAPCHGSSATGSLSVSISGPASLAPGATDTYTFMIGATGSGSDGGALNVAIISTTVGTASLGDLETNTQLSGGEITHTDAWDSPPAGNIGDFVYTFSVTAPNNLGSLITIAAVGMHYNGDFDNANDTWNRTADFLITVPEPMTGGLMAAGGLLGLFMLGRRKDV